MFETLPKKKSTLFKRKCCNCLLRKKVAYSEDIMFGLERVRTLFYCESCGDNKINRIKLVKDNMAKEQAEMDRLDYLKKEIERKEIEKRAKELGIEYPID